MVRTTSYGLPIHLHDHIDVIQPTTMFGRFKQHKSTIVPVGSDAVVAQFDPNAAGIDSGSKVTVNPSCKKTITIQCLQELYNAVGVVPSATNNNSIAVTGYLVGISLDPQSNCSPQLIQIIQGQFANIQDLELFYADQVPAAVGTNFTFVSVDGNSTK